MLPRRCLTRDEWDEFIRRFEYSNPGSLDDPSPSMDRRQAKWTRDVLMTTLAFAPKPIRRSEPAKGKVTRALGTLPGCFTMLNTGMDQVAVGGYFMPATAQSERVAIYGYYGSLRDAQSAIAFQGQSNNMTAPRPKSIPDVPPRATRYSDTTCPLDPSVEREFAKLAPGESMSYVEEDWTSYARRVCYNTITVTKPKDPPLPVSTPPPPPPQTPTRSPPDLMIPASAYVHGTESKERPLEPIIPFDDTDGFMLLEGVSLLEYKRLSKEGRRKLIADGPLGTFAPGQFRFGRSVGIDIAIDEHRRGDISDSELRDVLIPCSLP